MQWSCLVYYCFGAVCLDDVSALFDVMVLSIGTVIWYIVK